LFDDFHDDLVNSQRKAKLEEDRVQEQQLELRGQGASLQCLTLLELRERMGQVAAVVVVAAAVVVGVAETCAELQSLPSSEQTDGVSFLQNCLTEQSHTP
jgi:hypothetical protein